MKTEEIIFCPFDEKNISENFVKVKIFNGIQDRRRHHPHHRPRRISVSAYTASWRSQWELRLRHEPMNYDK